MSAPEQIVQPDEPILVELAQLSPIEFDRVAEKQAAILGCKLTTLRAEVERRRPQKPERSPGNRLVMPEVAPSLEWVDGGDLLESIRSTLQRFLILPLWAAELLAVWILHTYVFECFRFTGYLHVTSPERECGKSTLAELLACLCHKATTPGGMTAAAMYRRIQARRPTLLLDEWDTLRDENRHAAMNVLNTGFKYNGVYTICVGDDHEDRDFSTFCPKAIFGLAAAKLPDTTRSRCFPIALQKKLPGEKVEKLTRKFDGSTIRARCMRWANDHRQALSSAEPMMPEGFGARQEDIAESLIAVADVCGGHWPATIRRCVASFFRVAEGEESSVGVELLKDIAVFLEAHPADRFGTRELCDWLNEQEARQWGGWNEGKGITQRQLCTRLRVFGVQSRDIWAAGKSVKGFHREQLTEPFARYLLAATDSNRETARPPDNIGEKADLPSARNGEPCGSENAVLANKDGLPRGLADKTPAGGSEVGGTAPCLPGLVEEIA